MMKKMSRKVLTLILVVAMVFGCIPVVYGAVSEALSVEIITDKDEYAKGEEAKITLKFTNTGSTDITNISGEIKLPDGIVLSKDCSTTVTLASLSAGADEEVILSGSVADSNTDGGNDGKTDGGDNKTGDTAAVATYAFMAVAAMAVAMLVVGKKKDLKKLTNVSVVVFAIAAIGAMMPNVAEAAEHLIKAEKTIKIDGKSAVITAEVKYTIEGEEADDSTDDNTTGDNTTGDNETEVKPEVGTRVSVHDPSIVKDPETGMYYIFGSHMAWAKSEDLVSWTTFTNNINTNYNTIFAEAAEWSALGGTQKSETGKYEVSGNLWAPDVIWNEELGKWCMYMSVNGDNWYTSVVLLTADSLEGDWTLVGPVVYSGFTNAEEAAKTDLAEVIGTNEVPDRYLQNRNGNRTYSMNAIDPCVFYDEDGTLWMTYGSWFGGIYMLKLDESTGLRDYDYTYETVDNTSDAYQGVKIAGGSHVSGEAPYIEKIGDYYYLFMSYGGLVANGGYNMRVFRSESVTGPYVDASGDDARYTAGTNNINGTVGIKLLGNYQWSYMKYGQVAQGHNSAFVDDDGKAYVIYHTRTTDGTEGHTVRVHQLFANEDGWLVAAPYEYMGETLETTGYEKSEVLGTYEVLYHKQSVDYTNLECATAQALTLNEDGTVTGDYEGTWTMTDNSPYVQLTLGDVEYKGVFIEQYIEEYDEKTMCFTLLGDNEVELWGSKYLEGEAAIEMSLYFDILTMPEATVTDIDFITEGLYGTVATYSSSDTSIIANDGTVTRPEKDTVVTINATYKNGGEIVTKAWEVKVLGTTLVDGQLLIGEFYTDEECSLGSAEEGTYSFANPFNKNVINGLEIYNGVSIEFDVEGTGSYLSTILSFQGGGRMYFTGGSYLGYNALGGYFDANVQNGTSWAAGTDFINGGAHIKINITATGFEVYADDVLAYSLSDLTAGTIKGSNTVTSFSNVLKWLNNTAETIDFGWGSWWADKFNGTISNVKLYAAPVVAEDTSDYVWYESFSKGDKSAWTATTILNYINIVNDGTDRGNYIKATTDGGSGNRSAYMAFDEAANLTGNYTVSMDVALTAGVLAQRSVSSFAIVGTDATYNSKGNTDIEANYILKLINTAPTDSAANTSDYSKQDKWIINDADSTEITIPVGTWVTITADVNTTAGTAKVTIVNVEDGTEYYNGTVIINGTGELGGVHLFVGRGVGTILLDSIGVKLSENTGSDDTGSDDTGSDDTGSDDTGSDDTGSDDTGSEEEKNASPVYLYDFELGLMSTGSTSGATTEATIVGNGQLVQDSERGQVFDNYTGVTSTIRENYLSLPSGVGSAISGFTSKELTIAMWVKSPEANNEVTDPYAYYSPLFAMKDAEGTDSWPLLNVGLRGTSQVNWAGYIDNNANADITYLADNEWHYIVATFSEAGTTVYVDGTITNTSANTTANSCMGIFGAADGTWDSVNVGGNNIWGWNDLDSHLYYDDIAIYDVALTAEEVAASAN